MKRLEKYRFDFPREKLEKYGHERLADYELLAILLGTGIQGVNVLQLSKQIVEFIFKHRIENLTIDKLATIKGLGRVKACQVIAALTFAKRFSNEKPQIITARDIWLQCHDIRASQKEHLVAFYLDSRKQLIERRIISIGILDANLIHPREIYEPALALHAASIIIAHNHPSGCLEASWQDKEITTQVIQAGEILGIEMYDHIILSKDGYISHRTGAFDFT